MLNQKGFSLIELLVVIAIIGILSTIAMPQYSEYKKRAYDSAAKSDIRNIIIAQEGFFIDNSRYTDSLTELYGFKASNGVKITLKVASNESTEAQTWQATVNHPQGTANKKFCYNSELDTSIRETGC
jgi:type IV pilus assembly protein PilA